MTDLSQLSTMKFWQKFIEKYAISERQQDQFRQYIELLLVENEKYNITAIDSVQEVVADHFYDSLALTTQYDLSKVRRLVDVGSGGGFPGIPLAIMASNVQFCLVEVNLKKVHFLNLVIAQLGLTNVEVCTQDWRTFLRTYKQPVDMFIARASLQLDELLRIFKPSSMYQQSTFVYWASAKWVPMSQEKEYLDTCSSYQVGEKQRQLCFFRKPEGLLKK